jgi:hypothetical protein
VDEPPVQREDEAGRETHLEGLQRGGRRRIRRCGDRLGEIAVGRQLLGDVRLGGLDLVGREALSVRA